MWIWNLKKARARRKRSNKGIGRAYKDSFGDEAEHQSRIVPILISSWKVEPVLGLS